MAAKRRGEAGYVGELIELYLAMPLYPDHLTLVGQPDTLRIFFSGAQPPESPALNHPHPFRFTLQMAVALHRLTLPRRYAQKKSL